MTAIVGDQPQTWTELRITELRSRIDRNRSQLSLLANQPQSERIEWMMADCRDTIYASRAEIQRLSVAEQAAAHEARMEAEYQAVLAEGQATE